jgi:hypothetical protein
MEPNSRPWQPVANETAAKLTAPRALPRPAVSASASTIRGASHVVYVVPRLRDSIVA